MICPRADRYLVARIPFFWDMVQGCLRLFILNLNSSIISITINIVINILLVRYIKGPSSNTADHNFLFETFPFFVFLTPNNLILLLLFSFFLLHQIPLIIYLTIILKLVLTYTLLSLHIFTFFTAFSKWMAIKFVCLTFSSFSIGEIFTHRCFFTQC